MSEKNIPTTPTPIVEPESSPPSMPPPTTTTVSTINQDTVDHVTEKNPPEATNQENKDEDVRLDDTLTTPVMPAVVDKEAPSKPIIKRAISDPSIISPTNPKIGLQPDRYDLLERAVLALRQEMQTAISDLYRGYNDLCTRQHQVAQQQAQVNADFDWYKKKMGGLLSSLETLTDETASDFYQNLPCLVENFDNQLKISTDIGSQVKILSDKVESGFKEIHDYGLGLKKTLDAHEIKLNATPVTPPKVQPKIETPTGAQVLKPAPVSHAPTQPTVTQPVVTQPNTTTQTTVPRTKSPHENKRQKPQQVYQAKNVNTSTAPTANNQLPSFGRGQPADAALRKQRTNQRTSSSQSQSTVPPYTPAVTTQHPVYYTSAQQGAYPTGYGVGGTGALTVPTSYMATNPAADQLALDQGTRRHDTQSGHASLMMLQERRVQAQKSAAVPVALVPVTSASTVSKVSQNVQGAPSTSMLTPSSAYPIPGTTMRGHPSVIPSNSLVTTSSNNPFKTATNAVYTWENAIDDLNAAKVTVDDTTLAFWKRLDGARLRSAIKTRITVIKGEQLQS